MTRVRCAIYTRKSSDEGLEQSFNSLDAQREACAAYILSQASEGWAALAERYDDGGLSGGTLQRPALQRLLADVAAGRIDIIVVYKVDRLTRSLFDFAKLVEQLDASKTSFVSVTQSFNTTTSMGRLTLNMLLSFAQFEREVTAERIRDKIAASKAKGMWMGGTPPLGYAPDGRSLRIVEEHAALARDIFARYLALGNVRLLEAALIADGIKLPVRHRINGTGSYGGGAFSRGQIYKILSNPIYTGRIPHGDTSFAGLHPAIVDDATWQATQAKLADNLQGRRTRRGAIVPSLLAGKVVDHRGHPLIASHTVKNKVRYRYYISEPDIADPLRIPARELEALVATRVAEAFDDTLILATSAGLVLQPNDILAVSERGRAIVARAHARDRSLLSELITRVTVEPTAITITLTTEAIATALGLARRAEATPTIALRNDARLTRTGRVVKLIENGGKPLVSVPDTALIRLIAKAQLWWRELRAGELDVTRLAQRERVMPAYLTRVVRLAFLSPKVIEAIIAGRHSSTATIAKLTLGSGVAALWADQEMQLL